MAFLFTRARTKWTKRGLCDNHSIFIYQGLVLISLYFGEQQITVYNVSLVQWEMWINVMYPILWVVFICFFVDIYVIHYVSFPKNIYYVSFFPNLIETMDVSSLIESIFIDFLSNCSFLRLIWYFLLHQSNEFIASLKVFITKKIPRNIQFVVPDVTYKNITHPIIRLSFPTFLI